MKSKVIKYLLILNLSLLAIILIGKINFFGKFISTVYKSIVIPILVSMLIYYIIKPINETFLNKGIKSSRAALLTLIIFTFVFSGFVFSFGKYASRQFQNMIVKMYSLINNKNNLPGLLLSRINNIIDLDKTYELFLYVLKTYLKYIGSTSKKIAGYFMNAFSTIFLIIIIVYYMLRDSEKIKDKVLFFVNDKYKKSINEFLSESNDILNHYVTGQAKVALSLSIMIFIGYKIIGIPNALILCVITFVLAFIPFVGFFISMIIPTAIAISMGLSMVVKLILVFIIVQTLKGRIVVPTIMAKTMKIHPLTDIFLVIMAVTLLGPFAAFAVVPVYAILKNGYVILKKYRKS
ncbi:MAG: AI-2E family transporter [Clostridium sp.]|nr:AI-2E family transporter [Clostridium sp.]